MPLTFIQQVLHPITKLQVGRVQAAPVMTPMPDDLMPCWRKVVRDAEDEPVSTVLSSPKPNLSRFGCRCDQTPAIG